jgi:RimJ/RimL family protein N-acetyltransferase
MALLAAAIVSPALISTERLVLRRWRPEDREPYAAMMADPDVGYWLGATQTREAAHTSIDRFEEELGKAGYGFFAMETRIDGSFVGAATLRPIYPNLPVPPGHEIGWRLARSAWGNGYASEAARALLAFGFKDLSLTEIIAFTAESNIRSRAVMDRIGMRRDAARDFNHPALAEDHPLLRHVVYSATP